MSQDTGNKQCQICHGYLFEEDDVVVCPECGAPHHRDCWNTVGHCGLAELHGTNREYGKQPSGYQSNGPAYADGGNLYERLCPHCGKRAKATDALFCPYCGKEYASRPHQHQYKTQDVFDEPDQTGPNVVFRGMFDKDSYGGIPKSAEIEGVKVEQVAKFVGNNAHRYIPRFAVMKQSNRRSWNWAAFLFPSVWCMSRKMYVTGIMYFILFLAASLCFVPFMSVLSTFTADMPQMNYMDYANEIVTIVRENFSAFGWPSFALLGVGLALQVVPRIICGKTADWTYRGFALNKVKTIINDPEVDDVDEELMHAGSVNIFLMLITFLAQQYLPSIIATFIW